MAACPKCKREIRNGNSCQFCSATVKEQPIRAVAVESSSSSSNARLAPAVATTVPKPAVAQPSQPAVSQPMLSPPAAANATAAPVSPRSAPLAGDRTHQASFSRSTSKISPVAVTGAVLGVGLLFVSVIFGVLVATGKLSLPTSSATSSESGSEPNKANSGNAQKQNEELKKELRQLEERERKLKESISREQLKLEDIEKKVEEQEELLEKLISANSRLNRWRDVHVVIGEPSGEVVAIRREADGHFRYVDKVEPALSQAALLISHKGDPRWIANSRLEPVQKLLQGYQQESQLTLQLQEFLDGLLTPGNLLEEGDGSRRFVTYRLLNESAPKFGIYCGSSSSQLDVQLLGESKKSIAKENIAEGSARLISREELKHLDDGEFLDAALLEAIEALEAYRKGMGVGFSRIAVRVKADQGQGLGYVMQSMFRSNHAVNESQRATKLIESELYSKLMGLTNLDRKFEVVSPENFSEFAARSIAPRAVAAAVNAILGRSARRFVREQTKESLEDYMSAQEGFLSYVDFFLEVKVSPPTQGGEYFLDIKLRNARTRGIIYATAGDRFFHTPGQLYFPASGKLALMKGKDKAVPAEVLHESNFSLQRGGLFSSAKHSSSGLVIYEGQAGSSLYYRTLLGSRLSYAQQEDVEIQLMRDDYLNAAPVPDRIRLAAHLILRATLPPSGIVQRVTSENVATISIGSLAGLKVGDRLGLARSRELNVGEWATYEVVTPITVNKVSEVSAEVSCVPSGLEHMFEAERLQRGDIVFAKSRNLPIVVIEPFKFVGCADQKVAAQVRWDVRERRNRLSTMANDATKMLHERIGTAIKSMDIPQVSYKLCPTGNYGTHKVELVESYGRFLPPDARITRIVGGEVSIISNNDCQFDFHIREPVSQQLVKRFAITLDTGR